MDDKITVRVSSEMRRAIELDAGGVPSGVRLRMTAGEPLKGASAARSKTTLTARMDSGPLVARAGDGARADRLFRGGLLLILLLGGEQGRSLSFLELNASPPFNYAHDHFGFRDRLSQPVMKGSGEEPTPGSGDALEPGEFILGYPDENGSVPGLPQPEVLV